MKKQGPANPAAPEFLKVLSVSPLTEDYLLLRAAVRRVRCEVHRSDGLESALTLVRGFGIGLVVCERELSPGNWMDMLAELKRLPHSPPLIVTSRLADVRFWAEALKLGAYDVLAKPFAPKEVVRIIGLTGSYWRHGLETPKGGMQTAS